MNFKEILTDCRLADDILEAGGSIKLEWLKQVSGCDLFRFLNKDGKPVAIFDDADYLKLFMQIAEKLFSELKDTAASYLCACSLGGGRLIVKPFTEAEKQQYIYSYLALTNAIKQLPDQDRPVQLNFFSEISYEDCSQPKFVTESQKVARILKDDNRTDWLRIVENRFDFLKTDMYVYNLLRLHSWGFQAVTPNGEIDGKYSTVRPIRPKPRGAVREKRRRRN